MLDKTASTNKPPSGERRRAWWCSRPRLFLVVLLLSMHSLVMAYLIVRVREINRVYREFLTLQIEVNELQKHHLAQTREAMDRTDTLERVLFGNVVAQLDKVQKMPPSQARVQLWQKNRDAELRDRILNLEYWRHGIEQGYRR